MKIQISFQTSNGLELHRAFYKTMTGAKIAKANMENSLGRDISIVEVR